MRYATPEVLILSPLPCWKHLTVETRRRLVADLVAEIEAEAAIRRQQTGSQVLGVSAVRGQHPLDRPKRSKKSPAPLFHAASKAVLRQDLYAAYGWFVAAYRDASEKLRTGNRTVPFPLGSFPPRLAVRGRVGSRQQQRGQTLILFADRIPIRERCAHLLDSAPLLGVSSPGLTSISSDFGLISSVKAGKPAVEERRRRDLAGEIYPRGGAFLDSHGTSSLCSGPSDVVVDCRRPRYSRRHPVELGPGFARPSDERVPGWKRSSPSGRCPSSCRVGSCCTRFRAWPARTGRQTRVLAAAVGVMKRRCLPVAQSHVQSP